MISCFYFASITSDVKNNFLTLNLFTKIVLNLESTAVILKECYLIITVRYVHVLGINL